MDENKPKFCDNCELPVSGYHFHPISKLKKDIASANKGESAILCSNCIRDYLNEPKKKILVADMPKEEQLKSKTLIREISRKKYQVTVKIYGETKFMYTNSLKDLDKVTALFNAEVLEVAKLHD